MPQPVKLQDFLVNQHVPARWRDRLPLVTSEDQIIWVVGQRIAECAKVPEGAERALLLEYQPPSP
jgi:tRNA(Ile)-lysidine synthase